MGKILLRRYVENFVLIFITSIVTSSAVVVQDRINLGEFVSVSEIYGVLLRQGFWIFNVMFYFLALWALFDFLLFHPLVRLRIIPHAKKSIKWKKSVIEWYNYRKNEKEE